MNGTITAIVTASLLLSVACGEYPTMEGTNHTRAASVRNEDRTDPDLGYGWDTPIEATKANGFGKKGGNASHTVADLTIGEIVTDAKIKIRADNKSCVSCHSWAAYQDRESFCNRVDDFLKMPTAKGNNSDGPAAKPANLKKLLRDWQEAGCPE